MCSCVHPEWPVYFNQLHLSENKFRVERINFQVHVLIEWFEQARGTTHYYYGLAQAYTHFAGQVARFLRHTRMQSCPVTFPSKGEPGTVLLFAFVGLSQFNATHQSSLSFYLRDFFIQS